MKTFQKILVHTDPDGKRHHALHRAARLARQTGAALKIVDVVNSPPRFYPQLAPPPWVMPREIAKGKLEGLKTLVAPIRAQGLDVSAEVLMGTPFMELIREVQRNEHDLLMKTGEGGGVGRIFGSTDMHLLRKCPCPVGVIKPARLSRKPRIVAAVDPVPGEPERNAINHKILDMALSLANWEQGEVHIVHAWHVFGEGFLRGHRRDSVGDLKDYLARGRALILDTFREFLAEFGFDVSQKNVHLIKGDAAMVIPKFVSGIRADLLVMGTLARRGVAGMLIGNTAEKIVHRVDCSLLAVKPGDFVSPVRLV